MAKVKALTDFYDFATRQAYQTDDKAEMAEGAHLDGLIKGGFVEVVSEPKPKAKTEKKLFKKKED